MFKAHFWGQFRVAVVLLGVWFLASRPAFAQEAETARRGTGDSQASQPKVVTYVSSSLAIPAGIIALLYSFELWRKTRLEKVKTELQIAELRAKLASLPTIEDSSGPIVEAQLEPIRKDRVRATFLPRLIILYFIATVMTKFYSDYNTFVQDLFWATTPSDALDSTVPRWAQFTLVSTTYLITLLVWAVILFIGWPLFRDANTYLGVNIKDFLKMGIPNWSIRRTPSAGGPPQFPIDSGNSAELASG